MGRASRAWLWPRQKRPKPAVEGKAQFIVTGDKDLLVLSPFEGIPILGPPAFRGRFARCEPVGTCTRWKMGGVFGPRQILVRVLCRSRRRRPRGRRHLQGGLWGVEVREPQGLEAGALPAQHQARDEPAELPEPFGGEPGEPGAPSCCAALPTWPPGRPALARLRGSMVASSERNGTCITPPK